jgi:hypothetical protein
MNKKIISRLPRTWKSVPPEELESRIKQIQEKRFDRINELKALSKSLHELVVSENFFIEKILGQSYAESFTPISETMFGGRSPKYDTGYSSNVILIVMPERDIPVRTLIFGGNFPGLAGYRISAKIPRYIEKTVSESMKLPKEKGEEIFYIDREFGAREESIELSILSKDGRIIRTDRSVDYKTFFPEEEEGND